MTSDFYGSIDLKKNSLEFVKKYSKLAAERIDYSKGTVDTEFYDFDFYIIRGENRSKVNCAMILFLFILQEKSLFKNTTNILILGVVAIPFWNLLRRFC